MSTHLGLDGAWDGNVPKEGTSILIDVYDTAVAIKNEVFWTKAVRSLATAMRCNVEDTISKRYKPHGLTVVSMISLSHISVHTWPEHRFAAIDIYTCQDLKSSDWKRLKAILSALGKNHTIKVIDRGKRM